MREHGEKISRVPGDLLDRIFSIDSFEEYAEFIEISSQRSFSKRGRVAEEKLSKRRAKSRSDKKKLEQGAKYLGQGWLTTQKSSLEGARCINGVLPGEGYVRRCRRALAKPRQGNLPARLLGDCRRFPGR